MRRMAAIERALERLFERPTARLLRVHLQPVQILRRVERAMEAERRPVGGRAGVPDQLSVRLNPADLEAFDGIADALALELADGAFAFARSHGYLLRDRPRVALRADPSVENGDVLVDAAFGEPAGDEAVGQTRRYVPPAIEAPAASLRVIAGDGTSRVVALDGRRLTIGRAPDNGLVLAEGGASRHHALIRARDRSLVLADLGSTNGTRVNGLRITETALGDGDRIEIGGTLLVVEAAAGPD